jgi:hypothetical protein
MEWVMRQKKTAVLGEKGIQLSGLQPVTQLTIVNQNIAFGYRHNKMILNL